MRSLERGDLSPTDAALTYHLDRCLGCRACEPVCPSGVRYGHALETARERLAVAGGVPWLARAALWALTTQGVSGVVYWFARVFRATGIPRLLAGWGRIRFAMGMLAATNGGERRGKAQRVSVPAFPRRSPPVPAFLFRGCVMEGLFPHVHGATIRTLQVNGYEVREVEGQVCCGALHAHAGLGDAARELARANVAAFGDGDEPIVVNSAGCGAFMKEYGGAFSARVRDVTELLAANGGPVPGGPVDLQVAYDPPCHLLHAQRISQPPERLFAAIPLLRLVTIAGANDCCGSAGLFTLVEPEMSRAVLQPKLEALSAVAPQVVATGNPGCAMQIGAGLAARGVRAQVRHPVELLDASYRAAGRYE